ncbi:hypothetical protein GCM10022199_19950 [Marihabitans asiaticum]|uniref:Uncharacterized protein n=1 Tax=Marihabitans asiaticum TaxID=415218 RepID=A0A560WAX3_9MICO|nr:hypothetical protein [Marihabitans asiaticum]TWD14748.1 hypothetical protein FB557_2173 [Marihabitans asiaticum]
MPSYRVAIDVHETRPGVAPATLLPTAERLLAATHRVEDRSVELVSMQPQIHLRFLVEPSSDAEEDAEAEGVVTRLVAALGEHAILGGWTLRRGPGGHWRSIREGVAPGAPEFPVEF